MNCIHGFQLGGVMNSSAFNKQENELVTINGLNWRTCSDDHDEIAYRAKVCPMCVVRLHMEECKNDVDKIMLDCFRGIFKDKV